MTDPGKRYKVGMYGGKFLPFHKGHAHCIDVASSECDILYVVLFYDILEGNTPPMPTEMKCSHYARTKSILDYIANKDDNIKLILVHKITYSKNGMEDWYAEAEYIMNTIKRDIDVIYSSEPSYTEFFSKVYSKAVHRLIDPERQEVSISGTEVRSMDVEEAKKWIM